MVIEETRTQTYNETRTVEVPKTVEYKVFKCSDGEEFDSRNEWGGTNAEQKCARAKQRAEAYEAALQAIQAVESRDFPTDILNTLLNYDDGTEFEKARLFNMVDQAAETLMRTFVRDCWRSDWGGRNKFEPGWVLLVHGTDKEGDGFTHGYLPDEIEKYLVEMEEAVASARKAIAGLIKKEEPQQ